MSATRVGTLITLSGSNTSSSIVSDIGNTTYAETLLNDGGAQVYHFKDVRFHFNSGASWTDERAIILHTYDGSTDDYVFDMADNTCKIEWGYLDETDTDKPVTALFGELSANCKASCVYSFKHDGTTNTWFEENDPGAFKMYGGMLRFITDTPDSGNDAYDAEFPEIVKLIQVNVEAWGGVNLRGDSTSIILKEVNFKNNRTSANGFTNYSTSGSTLTLSDIQFHYNIRALVLAGGNAFDMWRVRLRGNTYDIKSRAQVTTQCRLIDSDTLSTTESTINFSSSGKVIEATSYEPKAVQTDAQTGETGVRVFCYQKSSEGSTGYGAEQVTSSSGEVTNAFICSRHEMNSSYTSTSSKLSYGNFAVRLRKFGKKFMDIEKVPGESGLIDSFIIQDNDYLVADETTASNYTGISLDKVNKELELTASRTIQVVYDYLQYLQKESGELAVPQLLKTKDGVSYSMPSSWSIVGTEYMDLGTRYIINRYVPITITGIVSGARCAVVYNGSTLVTAVSTGTSITLCTAYTASASMSVRVRLAGYKAFATLISISSTGNSVNANLQIDGEYN